jgi:hypothetical protein
MLTPKSSAPKAVDVIAFTFASTAGMRLRGRFCVSRRHFLKWWFVGGLAVARHVTCQVICMTGTASSAEEFSVNILLNLQTVLAIFLLLPKSKAHCW